MHSDAIVSYQIFHNLYRLSPTQYMKNKPPGWIERAQRLISTRVEASMLTGMDARVPLDVFNNFCRLIGQQVDRFPMLSAHAVMEGNGGG